MVSKAGTVTSRRSKGAMSSKTPGLADEQGRPARSTSRKRASSTDGESVHSGSESSTRSRRIFALGASGFSGLEEHIGQKAR